ncbi:hypothetical protein ASPBRDRAFT_198939 [Aspergillus brasiliensis CBS 101740]|uniref:Uncharacterized protein n=1 Tax=Aspergillus brasiliensis (strain CBS 101740 / IMI 381727 / IBT 21946) TaxID=767769 RepID=A0A1L9UA03_ASPBC|nr:hypothetical protein ASPBRDRAFT_198939 [Aspergillus brasiliensis CBS 101740]
MEHDFHAAVLLASDPSLDPTAVDAVLQEELLAAYRLLEQSTSHVKGIPQVLQTLRVTLQGRRSRSEMSFGNGVSLREEAEETTSSSPEAGVGEMNWIQLWAEFIEAAPQLDLQQWTSLLDDIDETLGTEPLSSPQSCQGGQGCGSGLLVSTHVLSSPSGSESCLFCPVKMLQFISKKEQSLSRRDGSAIMQNAHESTNADELGQSHLSGALA